MSLNDWLKQAIDKVDPDRLIAEAKGSAGELARQHGDKVEEVLDTLESRADHTTKGKYADKLASARRVVRESVAKVAAQPPVEDESPVDRSRPYGEEPATEIPPARD